MARWVQCSYSGTPSARPEAGAVIAISLHHCLDQTWLGTLAEIREGQGVARWILPIGGAPGTTAKSMSAYDMAARDAMEELLLNIVLLKL